MYESTASATRREPPSHERAAMLEPGTYVFRRIHQGYFRDVFPTGISALGYFRGWGKIKCYSRVKSLPGVNPNPPSGPILDPTGGANRIRDRFIFSLVCE